MGNRVDDDYDRHAEQQRIQENLQKKQLQEKSQQERAKFQSLLGQNNQQAMHLAKKQSSAQGGLKSLLQNKNTRTTKSSNGNALSSQAHSSRVSSDRGSMNRLDQTVHNDKEVNVKYDVEKKLHSEEEKAKATEHIDQTDQGFMHNQESANIVSHDNQTLDSDQQHHSDQKDQSQDQQQQRNHQPDSIITYASSSSAEVKQALSHYASNDVIQELVDEIAVHINDLGETEFEIQMKEGALEGVQVKVSLDSQKRVKTTFITNDKESADLIKQSKGQLQAKLYKKGLVLGHFEVQ